MKKPIIIFVSVLLSIFLFAHEWVFAGKINVNSASLEVIDNDTIKLKAVQLNDKTFHMQCSWNERKKIWSVDELSRSDWNVHNTMPTGGYWGATAVLYDKLYVFGGGGGRYNSVEVFDTISEEWTQKKDYSSLSHLVRAVTVWSTIYVLNDDGEFFQYYPDTDTWETLPDAPTPGWISELVQINENIYVFGGYGDDGVVNLTWEYNTNSEVWTEKTSMPTARYGSATAVFKEKIYVLGGGYGSDVNECYNPATDSWEELSSLSVLFNGWGVAGPSNGQIILVEAEDGTTIAYDPETDSYEILESIPTPREGYIMGDSIQNSLFVVGGNDEQAQDKVESYQYRIPADRQNKTKVLSTESLQPEDIDPDEKYKEHRKKYQLLQELIESR